MQVSALLMSNPQKGKRNEVMYFADKFRWVKALIVSCRNRGLLGVACVVSLLYLSCEKAGDSLGNFRRCVVLLVVMKTIIIAITYCAENISLY